MSEQEFENTLVAEPGEIYEELDIRPVKVPVTPNWNVLDLVENAPDEYKIEEGERKGELLTGDEAKTTYLFEKLFNKIPYGDFEALRHKWEFWARPNQLAPMGDWVFWLLLAGRGFGKTRTGAEWINDRVCSGKAKRIALVAPTAADVRKVMVEGESGLLAVSPPWNRPIFEPSKLQVTWPNGAIAQLFSAEEPERLRGPQCDTFWADELAAWKRMQETWDMLQFGFRLGNDPRGVVTTTPKPVPIVKELVKDDRSKGGQTAVTRGSTYDNKANLAEKFYTTVVTKYEGTRLGRQELEAEILEDMPGSLWNRTALDLNRIKATVQFPPIVKPADIIIGGVTEYETAEVLRRAAQAIMALVPEDLTRLVVAVDPNASNDEGSDEIGITVQGLGLSGTGYLLADCSMRGSPSEWASAAVLAHDAFKADQIIGEANQGGNMVEHTITTAAKFLKIEGKRSSDFVGVTLVHATRGKVTRAEPVSSLYEQNRIKHVGTHTTLEDQMCLFTSDFDRRAMGYSPDRVDALVWGFTHLFHEQQDGAGIFDFMRQEVERIAKAKSARDPAPEDWIRMKAPKNIGTLYGQTGNKYMVRDGHVSVRPDDEKGARAAGFVAV